MLVGLATQTSKKHTCKQVCGSLNTLQNQGSQDLVPLYVCTSLKGR